MRNQEAWKPSKYSFKKERIKSSSSIDSSSRIMTDLIAENYQKLLPEYAKGSLLDLGCGAAPLYPAYKKYVQDITCVDWGNTLHGVSYLDYEMDLNQPLDLKDATYDTVILSDVLEHIRKPELLLSEIYRVSASNATLIMNVPFLYWLHEKPHDYYRYTEFALRSMLEDAGFKEVEVWPIGGLLEVLQDFILKNVYPIPLIGKLVSFLGYKLHSLWLKTPPGNWLKIRLAKNSPFGYFAIGRK